MKKVIIVILSVITLFVLQGTLFRALDFGNTVPNLLIIITVSVSLMRGDKAGLLTGFFAGLLLDIFTGPTIGIYALIYMYIGYANGGLSKIFFPEDIKLPLIMVVLSDFIYGVCVYTLLFLLRGKTDFSFYFKNVIIPEIIYTIIITLMLYPIILFVNKKLREEEIRKARKFVS